MYPYEFLLSMLKQDPMYFIKLNVATIILYFFCITWRWPSRPRQIV